MQNIPAEAYDELPRDPVVTALKAAGLAAYLALVAGLFWAADGAIASTFERDPDLADVFMAPWVASVIILGFAALVVAVVCLLVPAGARQDEDEQ